MTLYIIATPIGNLEDLTHRAERLLNEVDLVVAEDTRHSRKLLDHYQIKTPLESYHSHSGPKKEAYLLNLLSEGKNLALISDAGTPGISDPGWALIRKAIEQSVHVVPIPGPSAFLTALMASGLHSHEFTYLGFPPLKKGRKTWFSQLKSEPRTIIFYESPHRLLKTLAELEEVFGPEQEIVLARELTKMHEEFLRNTLENLRRHFEGRAVKGEWVVLLNAH